MNNKLQAVRGTHDHLHIDMYNYNYIINNRPMSIMSSKGHSTFEIIGFGTFPYKKMYPYHYIYSTGLSHIISKR